MILIIKNIIEKEFIYSKNKYYEMLCFKKIDDSLTKMKEMAGR
jgi:hypothetical protein